MQHVQYGHYVYFLYFLSGASGCQLPISQKALGSTAVELLQLCSTQGLWTHTLETGTACKMAEQKAKT